MKRSRSSSCECLTRKCRSGSRPLLTASNRLFTLDSENMSRVSATEPAELYICFTTGVIIKKLRTKARPVMTWFGGTFCVPRALRRMESTTEILTNDVNITSTKGARVSAPRTITITTGFGSEFVVIGICPVFDQRRIALSAEKQRCSYRSELALRHLRNLLN